MIRSQLTRWSIGVCGKLALGRRIKLAFLPNLDFVFVIWNGYSDLDCSRGGRHTYTFYNGSKFLCIHNNRYGLSNRVPMKIIDRHLKIGSDWIGLYDGYDDRTCSRNKLPLLSVDQRDLSRNGCSDFAAIELDLRQRVLFLFSIDLS